MSSPEQASNSPSAPVTQSGGALYVVGMVVVGAAIVGLVMWQRGRNQQPPSTPPTPNNPTASIAAEPAQSTPAVKLPEFAPPPIMDEPEPEPAPTGSATRPATAPAAVGVASAKSSAAESEPPTKCSACGSGTSNATLNGAIRSRAGTAQGCYNRALRGGEAGGTMTVAVSVGSDGSVCGANVVSDSVNNPAISSCVLEKFRGTSYPPPTSGCVTVNVPIKFKSR